MKNNRGITLIALIITIIVMLILVAVSVNILIKSNLIGTAEKATNKYKTATEEEANGGTIEINGKKYNSIDDYMEEISPTIVEGDLNDWEFTVEDDDTITITGYKNTDTTIDTVVVPNYIGGKPVKKIAGSRYISGGQSTIYLGSIWNNEICTEKYLNDGSRVYQQNITIKKVVISSGIETIEWGSFVGTENLSEINIPNSVKYIGDYAFNYCTSLTEITIPGSVTYIGTEAFKNIPSITIHIPWKEGEKPDGWNKNWASTGSDCTITIDYAK